MDLAKSSFLRLYKKYKITLRIDDYFNLEFFMKVVDVNIQFKEASIRAKRQDRENGTKCSLVVYLGTALIKTSTLRFSKKKIHI